MEELIIKENNYFTKVPNDYIRKNIVRDYGVSRKFYIIYILIDRNRSRDNRSWITIRKILSIYGYKTSKNKPKAIGEILDVFEYMINNNLIFIEQDLDSIKYDTCIELKINPEYFDQMNNFTKLTFEQIDTILMADSSINKENLLLSFLYDVERKTRMDQNCRIHKNIRKRFLRQLNQCRKIWLCQIRL